MSDTPTRAGRAGIPSGALADAPPAPMVWLFDEHGALEGSQKARLSPNDWWPDKRAVWLLPPDATMVEPPAPQAGKVAVFDGERWSLVADHRGEVAYDKATQAARTIEAPGPIAAGETLLAPPSPRHRFAAGRWSLPLDAAKADRIAEVGAELARRNAAGFAFDGRLYQIDDASQARITALAVLARENDGADWPEGFGFIAADNVAVPFAAADFLELAKTAARTVIARRLNARALKDAILAAGDAAALAAIDITSGWE